MDELLDQLTYEDMATMINVGGWQTAEVTSVGKIATSDCDGPAGLNNFVTRHMVLLTRQRYCLHRPGTKSLPVRLENLWARSSQMLRTMDGTDLL